MNTLVVLLLALLAAIGDTTVVAGMAAPRLSLLLIAWLALRQRPSSSLWIHTWLVGVIADAVDPGSAVTHSLIALLITGFAQQARRWLFPDSPWSLGVVAGAAVVIEAVVYAIFINANGWHSGALISRGLATVVLALGVALLWQPWARRREVVV